MAGGVFVMESGCRGVVVPCAFVALSATSATVVKSEMSAKVVLLLVALKTLVNDCSTQKSSAIVAS